MIRFFMLGLIMCLAGCSAKVLQPKDIKDHVGEYIETFTFDDLPFKTRWEIENNLKVKSQFSGTITYSTEHYDSEVFQWKGEHIRKFIPVKHGLHKIVSQYFINSFKESTTFEMSYMGQIPLDVQSYHPGHRYFAYDYHLGDIQLIESDPAKGLQYDYEYGRRFQIADFWFRSAVCKPIEKPYTASTLYKELKGNAQDFVCTVRAKDKELLRESRVSYLDEYKIFVTKQIRNVNGIFNSSIKSIDIQSY